jgi:Holliday junction DNA helicase RuvB
LEEIVVRGAKLLGIAITADAAREIADRARGTPRVALRLLRRVRDFAAMDGKEVIDRAIADRSLLALEVDAVGLNALDRRYLTAIAMEHGGGPVGLDTIAAVLSEPCDAIEEIIEPYLIRLGFLQRTSRGRRVTPRAFDYFGLSAPNEESKDSRTEQATLGTRRNTIH